MNDNVVLEGGYLSFGALDAQDTDSGLKISNDMSGYTAAALATYRYSDQIELFGKAGMLWWENELQQGETRTTHSGSNAFVGIGANYDLGDNLGLRAEWERFEGLQPNPAQAGQSLDMLSLGVTLSSL
ncbi:MAG: outer membrane beta-barrel protein [Thiolinea sp.]